MKRRITYTDSYLAVVEATAIEVGRARWHSSKLLYRAAGAAVERICENPGLGHSLGGVMFSHALIGFPFSVIYEVTDAEICFLYLATL